MKNVSYHRNGWTIQVKADRAPNFAKNINHGNNTLIGQLAGVLYLGPERGVYNGQGCGACAHFAACQKTKNVRHNTDHCQQRPNRFVRAMRIQ